MNAALPGVFIDRKYFFTFKTFILLMAPNLTRPKLLKQYLAWTKYYCELLGTMKLFYVSLSIFPLMLTLV